jgi:ribosomal protein S18 acetylase RimI-like enzyme
MFKRRDLELVPVKPTDKPFLKELYCVSRDFEMAYLQWPETEIRSFLESQFELQTKHYNTHYKNGNFDLIRINGRNIGRLYIFRRPSHIRVMDITILRAYRNQGIGTFLMNEVVDEARNQKNKISLHVEPNNPAHRLYCRLGFKKEELRGVYEYMLIDFGRCS